MAKTKELKKCCSWGIEEGEEIITSVSERAVSRKRLFLSARLGKANPKARDKVGFQRRTPPRRRSVKVRAEVSDWVRVIAEVTSGYCSSAKGAGGESTMASWILCHGHGRMRMGQSGMSANAVGSSFSFIASFLPICKKTHTQPHTTQRADASDTGGAHFALVRPNAPSFCQHRKAEGSCLHTVVGTSLSLSHTQPILWIPLTKRTERRLTGGRPGKRITFEPLS